LPLQLPESATHVRRITKSSHKADLRHAAAGEPRLREVVGHLGEAPFPDLRCQGRTSGMDHELVDVDD
jgi:hypothetical protein